MRLPLIVGIVAGFLIIGYGMYVTDFTVYLGHDPNACNNCHIMDYAYEGWYHSGHHLWGNCIDCHTPQDFVPMYLYKAKSGYNHVTAFSLGEIPEPIRAKQDTKEIVQANCIRCHLETVENINDGQMNSGRYCFDCHRTVPHGERGISTFPYQDKESYKGAQPYH